MLGKVALTLAYICSYVMTATVHLCGALLQG
jgi:hypothetical protein